MEFFTCSIGIDASRQHLNGFRVASTSLMLFSLAKKEFTTKLLKVIRMRFIRSCEIMFVLLLELVFRSPSDYSCVHIINIDIQDNHEEATIGSFLIYNMAQSMANADDLDNELDELLTEFETTINRPLFHTIAFQ